MNRLIQYIRFDKPQILARENRYVPRIREAIEIPLKNILISIDESVGRFLLLGIHF